MNIFIAREGQEQSNKNNSPRFLGLGVCIGAFAFAQLSLRSALAKKRNYPGVVDLFICTWTFTYTYHIHLNVHIHIIYILHFISYHIHFYFHIHICMFHYVSICIYVYIHHICMYVHSMYILSYYIAAWDYMYVQKRSLEIIGPGYLFPQRSRHLFPHLKRVVFQGCKIWYLLWRPMIYTLQMINSDQPQKKEIWYRPAKICQWFPSQCGSVPGLPMKRGAALLRLDNTGAKSWVADGRLENGCTPWTRENSVKTTVKNSWNVHTL